MALRVMCKYYTLLTSDLKSGAEQSSNPKSRAEWSSNQLECEMGHPLTILVPQLLIHHLQEVDCLWHHNL